jgi:hypothetical protein
MNEKQDFEDKLMDAARALETELAPSRDLWPEIESAIARPSRPRWNTVFSRVAALVLLVGASSGLTYLAMQEKMSTPGPEDVGAGLTFERASFGAEYILGPDYQDARNNLRARLDEELGRLSPEARAEVEKNIRSIRAAINEINRALANEPDNALLQELLLGTYKDELSLMMKVDGVANAAMARTDI